MDEAKTTTYWVGTMKGGEKPNRRASSRKGLESIKYPVRITCFNLKGIFGIYQDTSSKRIDLRLLLV